MNPEEEAIFADAFAKAIAPKPVDPNTALPHYPAQRYIDKNLAPEKTLTYGDVSALAEARKHAESTGVLTPELGEHMLPMAMVEGRSGNFGIKTSSGFHPKPSTLKRFKDMGLSITDMTDPKVAESFRWDSAKEVPDLTVPGGLRMQYYRYTAMSNDPNNPGGPLIPVATPVTPPEPGHMMIKEVNGVKLLMPGVTDTNSKARMMAAILAEKHSINPAKTVDDTIKLYNGKGRAIEETSEGVTQQADVYQYLKKVKAAKEMLSNQKNKTLVDHFNSVYKKV